MNELARPIRSRSLAWPWTGLLAIALLASIGFFAGFAVPYLRLDEAVLARFDGRRAWILTHVVAGSVALFVGPFQLWMGLTGRALSWHRRLGFAYLTSIAVSSTAAFYLAVTTQVSWVFGAGLAGLACAWVVTTGLAFAGVLRRRYVQHQEWMIRSYVVTLAFVVFRLLVGVLEAFQVGTLIERLSIASWFCWAFPLLITEAVLQGRKIFAARETAPR